MWKQFFQSQTQSPSSNRATHGASVVVVSVVWEALKRMGAPVETFKATSLSQFCCRYKIPPTHSVMDLRVCTFIRA